MNLVDEKKEKLEQDIFRDVILKKNKLNISTYQICVDLNIEEELVADYFLGKSKDNHVLGIALLNYLEKKEND